MASFIPAPKTVRITTTFSDEDGHVGGCRFYLAYTGTMGIAAEYTAIAGAAMGSVNTNIQPLLHSSWQTGECVAVDLTSDTSPEGSALSAEAGALTGGRLPASTALVVSQETARRYRGGHSRVYLPIGDDTKLQNDSSWTTAFAAAAQTAWESVVGDTLSGFVGAFGTVSQVMASFYSGFTNEAYGTPVKYRRVPTPRASAVNFPVLNYLAKTAIGTQRRRLRPG